MAGRKESAYLLALPSLRGRPGEGSLYRAMREAILEGRLARGTQVPSTRDLAHQYGVARGTAVAAYDQLIAEGYLEGRHGAGTFVRDVLPDAHFRAPRASASRRSVKLHREANSVSFSARSAALRASPFNLRPDQAGIPFAFQRPDLHAFPKEVWSRLAGKRARGLSSSELGGFDLAGYAPLRRAIADYLGAMRGVACTPEQVLVLPSVQFGLYLAAELLLEQGDIAWIEDPGYRGAVAVLRAAGVHLVPIPVDNDGFDVAHALARARPARLVYLTPAHQAPLGVALDLGRRLTLLDWAHHANGWIFEDDYDSEYRYAGKPLAAMQSLDERGRVIYAGCFTKTLFPALRIAYLVLPPALVDAFTSARSVLIRFPPVADQLVLADFIEAGHYARHLRRMREIYAERRSALVNALEAELGEQLKIMGNATGLDLTCRLAKGLSESDIVAAATRDGLLLRALSFTYLTARDAGVVLGFSSISPARIRAGVQTLARVIRMQH